MPSQPRHTERACYDLGPLHLNGTAFKDRDIRVGCEEKCESSAKIDTATDRTTRRLIESLNDYFGKIVVGLEPNRDITGAAGLNEF